MKTYYKILIAITGIIIAGMQVAAAQGIIHYIENPVLDEQQQHYLSVVKNENTTLNYWLVSVDVNSLQKPKTIGINLAGSYTTVNIDRIDYRSNTNYSCFGRANEDPYSSFIFVVNGDMVTGIFTYRFKKYKMLPLTGGMHVLAELNESAFPPEESPEVYEELLQNANDQPVIDHVGIDPYESANARASSMANDCAVRVLVAYTDDVDGSYADPHSLVQGAIDDYQQANNNSSASHTIELARSVMVVYAESGDGYTDRDRFADPSDGYMDNIHDLRALYDADICLLLTLDGGGYCGVAKAIGASYSTAFAVVAAGCAIGNHSFAHEAGHLYGCRHDTYVDNTNTPYAYGHGYINHPDRWRTIMAYNDECDDNGYNCTRLQYWSNPNVTYGGDPMGTSSTNDNARVLRNEDQNLAAFESQVNNKSVYDTDVVLDDEQGHFIGNYSVTAPATGEALTFNSGSIGSLRAGSYIILQEGFWARYGSEVEARLYSCSPLRIADQQLDPDAETLTSQVNIDEITLDVYPNPFANTFILKYYLPEDEDVDIVVMDMLGKVHRTVVSNGNGSAGWHQIQLDGHQWPAGVYNILLQAGDVRISKRIMKAE